MNYVITSFEERVKEVELYHEFITTIINKKPVFNFGQGVNDEEINTDIYPILKANMFLLLYNLVESSFKEALITLSEKINDSNLKYQDSIPEIRKLWIECEKKYFSQDPDNGNKLEYFYNIIENLKDESLSVPSSLKGINLSENVDAKTVRECIERYGIALNIEEGNKLVIVKNYRNKLAHGNVSFVECGRDLVISYLKDIKDDVILFMRAVLTLLQEKCNSRYFHNAA